MNITVDFDHIEYKEPKQYEHICVTNGYYFRSGFWYDGIFIPDPDEPFVYIFYTTTGEK